MFGLGIRKLIVISMVGGTFLMGNLMLLAHWLESIGAVEFANTIREKFLTGTAITVIIALLILLVKPRSESIGALLRRCPVCDHKMLRGRYCSDCGSKA